MQLNYKHQEYLEHRTEQGLKVTLLNIFASFVLGVIKIFAGIFGHCYVLIADGIESVSDVFSSTIVYSGIKIGAIPPDHNHPYGHGKAEALAGIVVSFMLLASAVVIVVQAFKEIAVAHYAPAPWTLTVLVVVIIVKETMFYFLSRTGDETKNHSLKADAWHSRSDALTSLCALIGISVALWAGKGYESVDDWAAIVASGIIIFNGLRILKPAVDEMMDTTASPKVTENIRRIILSVDGVKDVEKCWVRKSGHGHLAEIHVEVDGNLSVKDGHEIAHRVKDKLLDSDQRLINAVIHIEPFGQIYPKG